MRQKGGKTERDTYSLIALLKDFVGQQFQGATVDSRLCSQVALNGMVGFTTVSGTSMENHLSLDGTSLRVPDEHTHKNTLSTNNAEPV